jgi:pyruvate/2-oxoglutarate dehydrogenase complex dihydrolipoamide dehydrogenase (E3) component
VKDFDCSTYYHSFAAVLTTMVVRCVVRHLYLSLLANLFVHPCVGFSTQTFRCTTAGSSLSFTGTNLDLKMSSSSQQWKESPDASTSDEDLAKSLSIWPLDAYNVDLLNEVRHKEYSNPTPIDVYDLVVIGAGAGGLVSSRQAARRGAKSCMISSELAGGDCLNAGCVPSKALLRCAKLIREARKVATQNNEYGISFGNNNNSEPITDQLEVKVDFPKIMERMRKLRAHIAPIDGHARGDSLGTQTFQGRGVFTSPSTIEVVEHGKKLGDESNPKLNFRKAVIATGGRPIVPDNIPGLKEAPYTTNLSLFNLQQLPKRMVILGAGVVALEMAQAFASFGSEVTVLQRSRLLSKGDEEAAEAVKQTLEDEGVKFLSGVSVKEVTTINQATDDNLPLMSVSLSCTEHTEPISLGCECLLLALGRTSNVESLGLESAGVDFHPSKGILVNDFSQSVSNPDVYAVGDCVADVFRLTHMSGEMAKVVVQNALFKGQWKLSSLVVPAVMYTDPEYATIGKINVDENDNVVTPVENNEEFDVYKAELQHNDRAILDSSDKTSFVKIFCNKGTGTIVGCTIVSTRAGEMINEVSLAMKHNISLEGVGRNIHSYPTLGEAVMGCGIQFINSRWETMN